MSMYLYKDISRSKEKFRVAPQLETAMQKFAHFLAIFVQSYQNECQKSKT